MAERDPYHDGRFGARLPVGPSEPAARLRCILEGEELHEHPIRFELHRYGRILGSILLCGSCWRRLNPPDPAACDPLTLVA